MCWSLVRSTSVGIKNTNKNKSFLRYLFDYCILRKIYWFKIRVPRLLLFVFFLPIRGRHDKFFLERSMHWDVEIKQWGGQKEVFKWNLKRQRCTFLLMEVCFWVERVCFRSTFLSSWHFLFLRGFFSFNSFVSYMLQEKDRYVGSPPGGIVGKSIRYCCIPWDGMMGRCIPISNS